VLQVASDMDTIDSSLVSSLFKDHAFAAMIDRGCFLWNNQKTQPRHTNTKYSGKASYRREFARTTSLDVSGSASYMGVTVSAGYKKSNTNSGGSSGTTDTHYGQETYSALVGELTNECFSRQSFFDKLIKDLVKQEWIDCWTAIRQKGQYQTVEDLLTLEDRDCFSKVADGGFLMPMKHVYKVGTKSTLSTIYTTSNTTEKSGASDAVTAGIAASRGGDIGVGGDITTAIGKAVEASKTLTKFTGEVKQETDGYGYNIDLDCFKNSTCNAMIKRSVVAIHADFQKLDPPTSLGREYKSLDDIIKLYFGGGYGLPDNFLPAFLWPQDSDSCLQVSPDWNSDFTCAGSAPRLCSEWSKDMHRCCPESCNTGALDEVACNALSGKGTCIYPNEAQCVPRTTGQDSDSCLQNSPDWTSEYTCAGSAPRLCSSWSKDMHRCCPESCNTGALGKGACKLLSGPGTCIYPNDATSQCRFA